MEKQFLPNIFQATVSGINTTVLQIQFMEATLEEEVKPFASPIVKRSANLSKSPGPSTQTPNSTGKRTRNNKPNASTVSTNTTTTDLAAQTEKKKAKLVE